MSDAAAAANPVDGNARRRNRRILLVVSLAANLLLVGFIVGQVLHHPERERMGGPMTIERVTGGLPPEIRETVRTSLREHRPEIVSKIAAVRAAQAELHAAIGAQPFDPARLQAAFAAIRERRQAVQAEVQEAAVEAIGQLPPETREKLAH
jgi:uncharacterized membrane protein